jgi:hypothetical protein
VNCKHLRLASEDLGITTDHQPYTPHLTLARQAQGAQPPSELESIAWQMNGCALVESTENPSALYKDLRQYPQVLSNLQRLACHVELTARHEMQCAQFPRRTLKTPATGAEHASLSKGTAAA